MNWVKTSERTPPWGGYYLVRAKGIYAVLNYECASDTWSDDSPRRLTSKEVDYWTEIEIPPLPKEKSLGERVYEAVKLAGVPNRPERMLYRLAMNAASREAATEHAIEGSSPYLQGPRPLKMLDGIRIVIDDTLEDGVVELLRA